MLGLLSPSCLQLQQPRWRGQTNPTLLQIHLGHDGFHKGDQHPPLPVGEFHLQQIIAPVDEIPHGANGAAMGQQPHLQAFQIQQMEFAGLQDRTLRRTSEEIGAHQGLCCHATAHPLQTHDIELFSRKLAPGKELHLLQPALAIAQPATARGGEPLREITERQHPQFPLKSLGGHKSAHIKKREWIRRSAVGGHGGERFRSAYGRPRQDGPNVQRPIRSVSLLRVVAPAGVALRSPPSTTGQRLALLPESTAVSLIQTVQGDPYDALGGSQRNDWQQVKAGELEGFVAALWLEPGGPGEQEESSRPREMRGVWICSHHHSQVWQSREALARALDELVELGWNTIFPAVWNQSFTAWPSAVMERHGLPKQDPVHAAAGIDPLQLAVELGKERGLTVIPWLEYGFAAEPVGASRGLLAAKPAWAALDRRGQVVEDGGLRWLNGLDPEVQAFLGELVLEVVERYGVDGVQGDDHMAIPRAGSHDQAPLERYRKATGKRPAARDDDPSGSRFRIEGLSGWVKEMGVRIHRVRPDLLWCLSPCPLPTGLTQLMQDSTGWLNNGSVDLLLPQLYRNSVAAYRLVLEGNLRPLARERRRQVVAGLTLRANGQNLEEATLLEMVRISREAGLGGVALFHHTPLMGGDQRIARALLSQRG